MPTKVELELDNISPLIKYEGTWTAGTSQDEYYAQYSNGGTFSVTNSNAAKASISFNGTGITVYGAKRDNHNKYSVLLDGVQPARISDGHSDTPIFDEPLFSVSNMRDGPHTLVIQNASDDLDPEKSYLDIDQILLETTVEMTRETSVQDFEVAWKYGPTDVQWHGTVPNLRFHPMSDESNHITASHGATATLWFMGEAVDLYGIVCQQCGDYGVTLDDGEETVLNAKDAHSVDNQVLYFARGLKDGQVHRLRVRNLGPDGSVMGIDHAVVYGTAPGGIAAPPEDAKSEATITPNPGPSVTPVDQVANHKHLPIAEIVCAVLGGLLLLLAIFVFFLLRQRKLRARRPGPVGKWRESIIPRSPVTPTAIASPFTINMQSHGAPSVATLTSPTSVSHLNAEYAIGMRPSTPAHLSQISTASSSENPFDVPGVAYDGLSENSLAYDQHTLLQSPPRSVMRSPSPAALVLHEAPPAYDPASRPASVVLDRKV